MREDFLHFIWKFKIFNTRALYTTKGEPVIVKQSGLHNHDSGPDFLHAQIQVGDKIWAGHVEIHIKASDWVAHKHSSDPAYRNVILHVVYIDDRKNASGLQIPTLELKNIIPADAFALYENFLQNNLWIPCADVIDSADKFRTDIWLERMFIERLESKSYIIKKLLTQNNNDWEQTVFTWLARNFGFKTNASAFEELAARTPFLLFAKHSNSLFQTEALLFGQAGFLADEITGDDYFDKLKKEYNFLAKKYDLSPIAKVNWKFMRMHPGNFPTIRIAQFASFINKTPHLLSGMLQINSIEHATQFFNATISDYWKNHYLFGKEISGKQSGKLGEESIINLLINTVVPVQFCYSEIRKKTALKEQAQELLLQVKPEINKITKGWQALGFKNENAQISQALIQLKNNYCDNKKCLDCAIGTSILKKTNPLPFQIKK